MVKYMGMKVKMQGMRRLASKLILLYRTLETTANVVPLKVCSS